MSHLFNIQPFFCCASTVWVCKMYPVLYRFNPTNDGTVYAASSDGTVSCTDLETGLALSLMNINPNGWHVIFYFVLLLEVHKAWVELIISYSFWYFIIQHEFYVTNIWLVCRAHVLGGCFMAWISIQRKGLYLLLIILVFSTCKLIFFCAIVTA